MKGVQLGLGISADASFRTLVYDGEMGASNYPNAEQIKRSETPLFATHVDLLVSYMFHSNVGLQSGLTYTYQGWQRDQLKYFQPINADQYDRSAIQQRYHYLNVPLKLVLAEAGNKKVRFRATIGMSLNILLGAQ